MTNPVKSARGVKLLLKVGDGATPENFSVFCSVNTTRGISFTAGTNDQDVIDCDDPDAVAWVAREKSNLSCSCTGAGTLDTRDVADFYAWLTSPDSKNCQMVVDVPSADGGVIFEGAFHLTGFDITGDRGKKQECTLTIISDGEVDCVANA